MIKIKYFDFTDLKHIEKWFPYWRSKGALNNSCFELLNIERMINFIVVYNDNELASVSGIDNVSHTLKDTIRILVRGASTKKRIKVRSEYIEGNLYIATAIAPLHCMFIKDHYKQYNVVTSTNAIGDGTITSNKLTRSLYGKKMYYMSNPRELIHNDTKQVFWDIDVAKCIEFGQKYYQSIGMDINSVYDSL